jgi:tetratricopeptide (TPR) repeat protein
MRNLNNIIEEAWKYQDKPEIMLKIFQEAYEDFSGNPAYLFEYANVLDFLDMETEAIPIYQKAIKLGLTGKMKIQAEIQLGSSLSVKGEHESAIAILDRVYKETADPASLEFLCIALFRSGKTDRALKHALNFILSGNQGMLPEYSRALSDYVNEIK